MRFWDSSAVVPLLCKQDATPLATRLRDEDPEIVVWMWTPVECVSALRRLVRELRITEAELWQFGRRLDELRDVWSEIADPSATDVVLNTTPTLGKAVGNATCRKPGTLGNMPSSSARIATGFQPR